MQRAHCVRGAPLPMMRYISKVYKVYSLVRTNFCPVDHIVPLHTLVSFVGPYFTMKRDQSSNLILEMSPAKISPKLAG